MEILNEAVSALVRTTPFLFVLTIVVFFHELGHFLVGRACGVGVVTFSIGFGPELFGWNDRHGTPLARLADRSAALREVRRRRGAPHPDRRMAALL